MDWYKKAQDEDDDLADAMNEMFGNNTPAPSHAPSSSVAPSSTTHAPASSGSFKVLKNKEVKIRKDGWGNITRKCSGCGQDFPLGTVMRVIQIHDNQEDLSSGHGTFHFCQACQPNAFDKILSEITRVRTLPGKWDDFAAETGKTKDFFSAIGHFLPPQA
jgi:hypothetical protein